MIEEYYHKPNLVPPFSFLVYIYWIFWKVIDVCKKHNKIHSEGQFISREQNLISNWINWTNNLEFYG
jgi:hypothetical protein